MSKIISCDPGLSGAIALIEDSKLVKTMKMPVLSIITKEAIKTLKLDSKNNKQYYKSGPNKGKAIYTIKTPAKTKNILDVNSIMNIFDWADTIIIERQNPRPGNSSISSFTTGINFGRLLACAELSDNNLILATPAQWKKDMHITLTPGEKTVMPDKKDQTNLLKAKACALALKLTGKEFKTSRGAMLHDEAESALVGLWYINKQEKK